MSSRLPPSAILSILALLALATPYGRAGDGEAGSSEGEAEATGEAAPSPAHDWLGRLEAHGRELKSYEATVHYIREQPLLGDRQLRIGNVAYHAGPPARFEVTFTHLIVDGARRERPRRFVFDGVWLAEVHPDTRQFIRRQVVAPGETFDPLKLGEGPFPLPLGQKREQVLALFEAELVEDAPTDAGDGEGTDADAAPLVHLRLTARSRAGEGEREGEATPIADFVRVDIWYDRATLLPSKLIAEDESANITEVRLREAKVDAIDDEAAAERFDTTPPPRGSGWRVETKPLEIEEPRRDEPNPQ